MADPCQPHRAACRKGCSCTGCISMRHPDVVDALAALRTALETAERERDEAREQLVDLHAALESIAPDGARFQLIATDEHGHKYPQFGVITTWSPYIFEDWREDGIREVNQYKYDEDSERGEMCSVGYFVDDEYFVRENEKHEAAIAALRADRDAWRAKAEARPGISADVAQTWSFWRDERLAGSPPSCSAQLDEEMEAVDRVAAALRAHASKAVR